jgi:hypothetical protein
MPWLPELFSAAVVEEVRDQREDRVNDPVPYFAGLISGETDALIGSFAGVPELHHPVWGRVNGPHAFERFVTLQNSWLTERGATFGEVNRLITPDRGVEEVVLTLDGNEARVEMPVAIAADRDKDARILELRVYFSAWPLSGRHFNRPPLLQPGPEVHASGVVGEYQRALAAGDAAAAVAAFEPDGYVREPAGGKYAHRGHDELLALYELFFSNGGGVSLEHCTVTDNGRACALEYNVVRWGRSELRPQAGLAVYTRGTSGKLTSAHIYDDVDPPLGSE